MLLVGSGVLADSLAQLLATQGLTPERAKADQAEQTARVLVPDLIVLAGDVARDRGKAMLAKLTSESPIATVVIATPELGGLTVQMMPRHVAFLGLEGGTGECARRIRSLAELFAEEGLATCSLQQLVDTVAPRTKPGASAATTPAVTPSVAKPGASSAKTPAVTPSVAKPSASSTTMAAVAPSAAKAVAGGAMPTAGAAKPNASAAQPSAATKQVAPARGVPVAGSTSLAEKAMAALEAQQAKARVHAEAAPRTETLKVDAVTAKPEPAKNVTAATPQLANESAMHEPKLDALAVSFHPANDVVAAVKPATDTTVRKETQKLDAVVAKPQPANDVVAAKTQPASAARKETQSYDAAAVITPAAKTHEPAKKAEPVQTASAPAKTALPSVVRAATPARGPAAQARPRATSTSATSNAAVKVTASAAASAVTPAAVTPAAAVSAAVVTPAATSVATQAEVDAAAHIENALKAAMLDSDPAPIAVAPPAPVISAALPIAHPKDDSAARISSAESDIYFSASEPAPPPNRADVSSDAPSIPAPAARPSGGDVFISMSDPAPAHSAPEVMVSMSEPAAAAPAAVSAKASEPDTTTSRNGPPPLKRSARNTLQGAAPSEAAVKTAMNEPARPLTPIQTVASVAPAERRDPSQPRLALNTAAKAEKREPTGSFKQEPAHVRAASAAEKREPTGSFKQEPAQPRINVSGAPASDKREPTGSFKREPTGAFKTLRDPLAAAQPPVPEKREPTGTFKREPTGSFKTLRDPLAAAEPAAMHHAGQPAHGTLAALLAEHARAEEPPSAAVPGKAWRASIYLAAIACCAALVIVRLGGPSKSLEAAAALGSLSSSGSSSSSSSSSNRRTQPTKPTPRTSTQPTKRPAFTAASNRFEAAEPTLDSENAPHQPSARELASQAEQLVDEGALLFEDGRLGLAEASYLKALKIQPSYPRAMSGLVRVHIERKDGVEALRWATMLVAKQPKNGQNQLLLGDAQALRGDMAAAKEAWTRATRLGNPAARQRLLPK